MAQAQQTRILTFAEAQETALAIFHRLIVYRMHFSIMANPDLKCFHLIGRRDADLLKALIPECEIQTDVHKRRFAELFIKYE